MRTLTRRFDQALALAVNHSATNPSGLVNDTRIGDLLRITTAILDCGADEDDVIVALLAPVVSSIATYPA